MYELFFNLQTLAPSFFTFYSNYSIPTLWHTFRSARYRAIMVEESNNIADEYRVNIVYIKTFC